MVQATWSDASNAYLVESPEQVQNLADFFPRIRFGLEEHHRVVAGFDFPIGVPAAYGRIANITNFLAVLGEFGKGDWQHFYDICEMAGEVSWRRPFYPYRPGGTKQEHLLKGLCMKESSDLLRNCERRSVNRKAACSIFWTLGANHVGRAAISGWRDLVAPALRDNNFDVSVWPFGGGLVELLEQHSNVIVETYPAEAYHHIGILPGGWSKRRQSCRLGHARTIHEWAMKGNVILRESLVDLINDGFGPREDGEDPFDALIGACSMIEVLLGRRSDGCPTNSEIRELEGWILGQSEP